MAAREKLGLGEFNRTWTTDLYNRLILIVYEFGENLFHLDDNKIETVLNKIVYKYNVGQGKERSKNALRSRMELLRNKTIHIFQEYERFRKDRSTGFWNGSVSQIIDDYRDDEIGALDFRKNDQNSSFKLLIRHELDKDKNTEDLVAAGFVGLDWILEGNTAYYVTPKIRDIDYAKMFVDVFTLDRKDSSQEWETLFKERRGMYRIDHDRPLIPLPKKLKYLGVRVFTALLLVHLIEMTWIMSLGSRSLTQTNPWEQVRDIIQRAKKRSLISRQAEKVITGFLDEKEKDTTDVLLGDRLFGDNSDDEKKSDNRKEEDRNSLLDVLETLLSSAEDSNSQNYSIPPFRIDMPKLFELYFYYLLARMDDGAVKPHIRYQFPCAMSEFDDVSKKGTLKPDFLIEGKGLLIDAKYKVDYNKEAFYNSQDICQVLSYTRIKAVIATCQAHDEIKTIIAFPNTGDILNTTSLQELYDTNRPVVKQNQDVIELYQCAIPLPKIR